MLPKIQPVIVCGGQGTRLWPISRQSLPKQFAILDGERSSFQDAVLRVENTSLFEEPIVIASAEHRFVVERQMSLIGRKGRILLEPEPRESGPAMLAGAVWASANANPESPLLFLAADHRIAPLSAFEETCKAGREAAAKGFIVMFGIKPDAPETRFGYIQPGEPISASARRIQAFVEKPDLETAKIYKERGYFWNSGNFLVRPDLLIEEYQRQEPDTVAAVRLAVERAAEDLGFIRLEAEAFAGAGRRSIDYAVMEHTARGAVVPASFAWSDLGTWDAYWQAGSADPSGNVFSSPAAAIDAEGCFTMSDGPLVALLGVRNLAVIATRDAVLVADRSRADDVKHLVADLRREGRPEAVSHLRSYRPWGWYQVLDAGPRFQVKRIVVYPGGRLSLQRHFHRAEHWVVVRGTALVTHGETQSLLRENESTYIPLGHVHRLENPGKIDLELIEVQSGSYLDEDDIVRLEDQYDR